MARYRDKYGKYIKLTKEKKAERALIAQEAVELNLDGLSMTKIAQKINVSKTTLLRIISSDSHWSEFLKKKRAILKAKMVESIEKDLKAQNQKRNRAKFAELGLSAAIKFDKVWPPASQVLTKIDTGSRTVNVIYPNFPLTKQEIEKGKVLQEKPETRVKSK